MSLKMKYFVLKPEGNDAYAEASRAAMREYASYMVGVNDELSLSLWEWVGATEDIYNVE